MKSANDAPMRRARAIVERVAVLLEDCHALQLDSEALLQTNDRARVEAETDALRDAGERDRDRPDPYD